MKWQTKYARSLRNNATCAEKYLWYVLRKKNLGYKFRRQKAIGNYIVDFVCIEKRLVIEVDGSQHANNKDDIVRDEWLNQRGYKVLRFWNNEVLNNRSSVVERIMQHLGPHPNPPHKMGRENTPP